MTATWAAHAAIASMALSGVGALALVRPHAGIPPRQAAWTAVGVAAYIPMIWFEWRVIVPGWATSRGYLNSLSVDPRHALTRLLFEGSLVVALLALRPSARMLAARSLLMREGRIDRQTMLALVAAVSVGVTGDLLHWNIRSFPPSWEAGLAVTGTLLIAVSSLLLTVGLVSVVVDSWRIRDVILDPPPTLLELIARDGAGA
jgi:hypothetical protein